MTKCNTPIRAEKILELATLYMLRCVRLQSMAHHYLVVILWILSGIFLPAAKVGHHTEPPQRHDLDAGAAFSVL